MPASVRRHTLEPVRHTKKPATGTKVLSVKLPRALSARVARLARERHTTVSAVVRDALERYGLGTRGPSFADAIAPYIGLARGPKDLSTSKRHLKGYGED